MDVFFLVNQHVCFPSCPSLKIPLPLHACWSFINLPVSGFISPSSPSVFLTIIFSVCPIICLSNYLSVPLSVCPIICLSHICLSHYMSVPLSVCLSVPLSRAGNLCFHSILSSLQEICQIWNLQFSTALHGLFL